MFPRQLSTIALRPCLRSAAVTPTPIRLARLASSVAAADLPRAPPHEKIPFSAPPKDETKGDLGQVHLPAMQEKYVEQALQIVRPPQFSPYTVFVTSPLTRYALAAQPSEPDAYRAPSKSDDFPSLHPSSNTEKLRTVASPTTHANGGPTLAANSADDTFEGFEGDHKLSASAEKEGTKQTSKDDGAEKSEKKDRKEDSHEEGEPLSSEERMGLFKLGGFIFGAWVLGGLTRPYKPQHPQKKEIDI
ncbi:hypothetical protein JCM16303_000190 [Sporobolomyces ruberrimus]